MKAFLTRLNRGLAGSKEKDREKDAPKEKIPQLPPLPEWPPQQRATSTPNSINSFKPLPELSVRPLPPIGEPSSSSTESSVTTTPIAVNPSLPATETKENLPAGSVPAPGPQQSSRAEGSSDSTGRSSRKTANGSTGADAQKKVAFLSPPPTPGPLQDRALPDADTPTPTNAAAKSTVSRFHAAHGKDTRGSTSTAASSRTDVASTLKSNKAASTRTATSPYPAKNYEASLHQSLRSGTPYSQMSNASSRILAAQSWSEVAEEDLVSNLGQRERTRQEVLWEIVTSEERYVTELLKMKETFIEPLLHPFIASPISSPTPLDVYDDFNRSDTPRESLEHLPIAARFLQSPTGERSDSPQPMSKESRKEDNHPNIDGESMDSAEEEEADDRMGAAFHSSRQKTVTMSKHNHPRSPYGTAAARSGTGKFGTTLPFPSRSHQSLPPPPRVNLMTSSTQSLGRQSYMGDRDRDYEQSPPSMKTNGTGTSRVLRKFKKSTTGPDAMIHGAVPPAQLPEDLRKCLEVIEGGILEGHIRLSEGLRKRYEDQYPLVRSLADVFVSNSHILHGYATYVLHLERALEQVDNALSLAAASKKPKKQDADQWLKICQYLQKLEVTAGEKGETGLAISLSKPFQRLLKYPLLFQNLLYHTDPSTFEYESTLQMVAEVETIVRSIEDEKIQKEERDKTRDVFARIEGLDKVKQLMVPKPSRVLVEERPVVGVNPLTDPTARKSPPLTSQNPKNVKGKTSFKRLSDVLQSNSNGIGGKKDLWLVVFNDVVLRCQRTGTTSLPLGAGGTNSRTNSLPELQGKAKYATTGRRGTQTKPRNLYKFLKIETWSIGDVVQPREGVVSMEETVKLRQQVHSGVQPRIVPMPDDDEDQGVESDDSDRKSKMSFSYWGADKVTLQKPVVKPKAPVSNGARRTTTPTTAYARESSANAKFGTRLLSTEVPHPPRPASRRTVATPTNRKVTPHSDEGHSVKVTITRDRPTWDSSTRATATTPVPKRPRNISQTSAATRVTTTPNNTKTLASPAPSEDSGVGFIRNMVNQDPSLNRLIP
ncbi:Dbl domain-containing protein [Lentinus tigrinus ALCF2SS1-7]|uniref:Dbl domain-containing protein n=1 Tax=Lentinus tigrinus ALCF2SS1-6 TaxID=1328759 RepID=A0A5C2SRH5_9APHY|nr:Dbl domain-containing protein [Lentinus tigrinus ALCF2SS1-6]RPD80203.1 Dbl domain-containing protein [Lentinus tigrinus ALCF2SS1-7]